MPLDIAADQIRQYGSMPIAMTFTDNDHAQTSHDTEPVQPVYSAAYDVEEGTKRHAACDECRKRKLKCSGEPTGCSRCVKQSLVCHYSEQKQMGRPRKRQKKDEGSHDNRQQARSPPRAIQPAPGKSPMNPRRKKPKYREPPVDPQLVLMHQERTQFENICNSPMARTIRNQRQQSLQDQQHSLPDNHNSPGLQENSSDTSHSQDSARTPDPLDPTGTPYPTDVAHWPDFSTLEMLPLPVEDKWRPFDSESGLQHGSDPDVNPEVLSNLPPVPACPCLPNLYLTLSTMSTLSSFPFTQETINTVETAFRTAKGVIYCSVCPQRFDTGSSNLMLSCTLLNVLSDQWNRLRKLRVDELRKSFGTADQQQNAVMTREAIEWRNFARQLIRAYVFGDESIPSPPKSAQAKQFAGETHEKHPELTLVGLCDALTRRQRQWHGLDVPTDEFPARVTADLTHGHIVGEADGKGGRHLCLEIVNHARCIVNMLDGPGTSLMNVANNPS